MPDLDMGKIDTAKMPSDVHSRYEHVLYLSQRKYYWLMVFAGGFLFLFSVIL